MAAYRRDSPQSALVTAAAWALDEYGTVHVLAPSEGRLRDVDIGWPGLRPHTHSNAHWEWVGIAQQSRECWAVVSTADRQTTLALWASSGVVTVEGTLCYVGDFIEVHPSHRGGFLTVFTVGLLCKRATELGCVKVLIPSLKETEARWRSVGAVDAPDAWNKKGDYVRLVLEQAMMLELIGDADESFDEQAAKAR